MKHGGNIYQFAERLGCLTDEVLDFSANINPEQALDPATILPVALGPYADPDYKALKQAIYARYPEPPGVGLEVFNGASAAIFALLRWLAPRDVVLYTPMYVEYAKIAAELGCTLHNVDRFDCLNAEVPEQSTVIFVNPSTPDGQLYDTASLLETWRRAACTIIVDESFLDFCNAKSIAYCIAEYDKLFVVKSLSKFYGCAGIRIGFVWGSTSGIEALKRLEPAWKLSSFDMAYIRHALANEPYIAQTQQQTARRRDLLQSALSESGLFETIYPGQANFILTKLKDSLDGDGLQQKLEPARILIRVCDNFTGLSKRHVRFAVKDEAAILALSKALKAIAAR